MGSDSDVSVAARRLRCSIATYGWRGRDRLSVTDCSEHGNVLAADQECVLCLRDDDHKPAETTMVGIALGIEDASRGNTASKEGLDEALNT